MSWALDWRTDHSRCSLCARVVDHICRELPQSNRMTGCSRHRPVDYTCGAAPRRMHELQHVHRQRRRKRYADVSNPRRHHANSRCSHVHLRGVVASHGHSPRLRWTLEARAGFHRWEGLWSAAHWNLLTCAFLSSGSCRSACARRPDHWVSARRRALPDATSLPAVGPGTANGR